MNFAKTLFPIARLCAFLAALLISQKATSATVPKPNVLVIIVDDLGVGDFGFSGGTDIPTPNIDKLAHEGIVFRSGYVSPMCAPTRAAFLTGKYPEKIGFVDNRPGDSTHFGLDLSSETIADVMKSNGYRTSLIGKWHVGKGLNHEYSPWNRGFDEFLGYYGAFGLYENPKLTRPPGKEEVVMGYSTDIFADAACEFLERNKTNSFFLNVAFNAAHLKQVAKPADLAKFEHIKDPKRRTAAAIISNLDENIGRIAAKLQALGLNRNTLLVFFSDNGGEPPILGTMNGPFRGMKFDVYEGGIRVPFLLRWPEGVRPGVSDELVSAIDLLPTIASATGAVIPKGVDGANLLPILQKKTKKSPHDALFWRVTDHSTLQQMRRPKGNPTSHLPSHAAMREGQWKLIVLDDAGKNPSPQLYNLSKDPGETTDLAVKEPRRVKRMMKEIDAWRATLKPQVIPPLKKNGAPGSPI